MKADFDDDILYMHNRPGFVTFLENSFITELIYFLGNTVKALFSLSAFVISALIKFFCFIGKILYGFFDKLLLKNIKKLVGDIKTNGFSANKKSVIRFSLSCFLPVAAVVILIVTIGYFKNSTYALEVSYNGKNIGCIADEGVLEQAENMARERLRTGLNTVSDSTDDVIAAPTYKLKRTSKNGLTDAGTLCDRMIEFSNYDVVNACGIYLDNDFLCAVKNETDAKEVFSGVLDKKKTGNITVDYIKKINYKPGLYPDDPNVVCDTNVLTKEAEGLDVKVLKTNRIKKYIPYSTVTKYSSMLYSGETRTIVQGQEGVLLVTSVETYIGGKRISTEIVGKKVIREPVTAKVLVGIKQGIVISADDGQYWNVGGGVFTWPAPSIPHITSYFGSRWGRSHTGIDISGGGAYGSNIVASASGTVESVSSNDGGYGCCVVIDHGNGIKTRYGHCAEGSIIVVPGQAVSQGEKIALVGSTGNSTGPHLHFEIIINGVQINPLLYL